MVEGLIVPYGDALGLPDGQPLGVGGGCAIGALQWEVRRAWRTITRTREMTGQTRQFELTARGSILQAEVQALLS